MVRAAPAPSGAAPPACAAEAWVQGLAACSVEDGPPPGVAGSGLRWLHLRVQAQAPVERLLGLGVPDAAHAELWQAPAGEPPRLQARLGRDARFAERPVPARRLAFEVALPAGATDLWLGYRVHADGALSPRLLDPLAARLLHARDDLLNGVIVGALLTLVGVVLAVRLLGRSSGYGAYALLMGAQLVMLGQFEGYWFAHLWPNAPHWNQTAAPLSALLTLAAHAGFALRFLQLRERQPALRWAHLALLGAAALLALGHLAQGPQPVAVGVLALLYAPLSLAVAWRAWQQRLPGAPFYALGLTGLLFWGVLMFEAAALGWNPLPGLDHFVFPKIGLLTEAACFAAALVNRLRLQREQLADERLRRLAEAEELLQLEAQRRAALELAQQQGLRLAGASHDISQPLASLRFAIEALRSDDLSSERNRAVTRHLDQTLEYAQTLLADLIAQTRAELPQRSDAIALGPWLQQLADAHQAQARARGLQLRVAGSRAVLNGSQLILARIVNNLLANALRYTVRGGVLLGVRRRPGALEIQVIDTGPGLWPEQLARLQQPFERGSTEHPGHGLGLFIVKSLCAQNGYDFVLRSRPGKGSCFAITVPTVSP